MSSSPRIGSPLIVILSGVLAWIIFLSYGMRRLFGAEVSGGWLLIGVLFTLGALGILVILNEIRQAVTVPAGFNLDKWKRDDASGELDLIDWSCAESRRLALGLSSERRVANRYRTPGTVTASASAKEGRFGFGGGKTALPLAHC